MVNGLKLTAKFAGKTKVEVTVQNLNTETIYKLMWDFSKPAEEKVSEDLIEEIIELNQDSEDTELNEGSVE